MLELESQVGAYYEDPRYKYRLSCGPFGEDGGLHDVLS